MPPPRFEEPMHLVLSACDEALGWYGLCVRQDQGSDSCRIDKVSLFG